MKISIITLFPGMLDGFLNESIVKRAQEKGLVELNVINLRDFASDSHGTIDDRPYSGGAGMVLMVEPAVKALRSIGDFDRAIITSPRGKKYNQKKAKELARIDHLVIFAGHYEGEDERIHEYIDEEISIGDFILTGGEIASAAIVDSVVRLLPGVLKKEEATEGESFFEIDIDELISIIGEDSTLLQAKERGKQALKLLEYPHYTRPQEFEGKHVPEILLSGDHKKIYKWQITKAFEITKKRRPDLL